MLTTITVIVISLIFSAFFSGTEIAYITANKLRIELDRKRGLLSGKILSRLVKNPSGFVAGVLVGNTIALVIFGIFSASLIEPLVTAHFTFISNSVGAIMLVQIVISTFFILIFAEFLPKIIFRVNPNSKLNFFSVFILFMYIILYPITFLVMGISNFFLSRVLKIPVSNPRQVFSPIDIDTYLEDFTQHSQHDSDIQSEVQIFQNARDLRNMRIRECMVPRPEIIAVDDTDSTELLKNDFIQHSLSKILIYNDTIDNITGYVHVHDMFKKPASIKSVLRPILFVPETMMADTLLGMFIKQNRSIAVVVDEFGGTSGLITLEDLVEEIFGEINDEYDIEELTEKKVSEDEYIFSGRLEIDYINEKYNLNLPEGNEYETLAGLIIHNHESIPEKGSEIQIPPFSFIIAEVSETKIEQVILKINAD